MIILFDTNVIIDVLQKHRPFFDDSYNALHQALSEDAKCLVSASSATDIFYILRKALQSSDKAEECIENISRLVSFADVLESDINAALMSPVADFDDAVIDTVAERNDADYIVTRNTEDFQNSTVQAITPADFIRK